MEAGTEFGGEVNQDDTDLIKVDSVGVKWNGAATVEVV